jgi:hypothetical protein
MGMPDLRHEKRVPAEVFLWNFHGFRNFVAVSFQKIAPTHRRCRLAQPGSILPPQRNNMCPNISGVTIQLAHGFRQSRHLYLRTAVISQPLAPGRVQY